MTDFEKMKDYLENKDTKITDEEIEKTSFGEGDYNLFGDFKFNGKKISFECNVDFDFYGDDGSFGFFDEWIHFSPKDISYKAFINEKGQFSKNGYLPEALAYDFSRKVIVDHYAPSDIRVDIEKIIRESNTEQEFVNALIETISKEYKKVYSDYFTRLFAKDGEPTVADFAFEQTLKEEIKQKIDLHIDESYFNENDEKVFIIKDYCFFPYDPDKWCRYIKNDEDKNRYIAMCAIRNNALANGSVIEEDFWHELYVYKIVGKSKGSIEFTAYAPVDRQKVSEFVSQNKSSFTKKELNALEAVDYNISESEVIIELPDTIKELIIDLAKEHLKKQGLEEENRKLKSETVQKKTEKTEKVKTDEIIDIESFRSNEPMRKIPEDLEKTLLPNAYKNGSDKIREQLRVLASKVKKYIEKDALVADLNARIRDLEDEIQHIEEHEMSGIAEEYNVLANKIKTDVEKPMKKSKSVERD